MQVANQIFTNDFDTINETGKDISLFALGDINQLLPPEPSPSDELERLAINDAEDSFTEAEDASLIDSAAVPAALDDEAELDLSPGQADRIYDPVRLYMREMASVALLTREGEVVLARRIERGNLRGVRAVSRSPICVEYLLDLGDGGPTQVGAVGELVDAPSVAVSVGADVAADRTGDGGGV